MGSTEIGRRTAYLWLAVAVAVGALLRWWTIGQEPLWGDEALSAVIARHSISELWLDPVDPTGPVYYLIHKALVPSGASATIARLPSLIAGLLTIVATYGLGRTLASRWVGALAATLVAVSSPMIEYSQEARGYAVLVALTTLSAWMLAKLFQPAPRRVRHAIAAAYIAATVAAASTHLVGSIWAVTSAAALLLAASREHDRLSRREALVILITGVVLMIPEFRRLALYAFGNNYFTWLAPGSLADLGRLVAWQWVPFAHRAPLIAGVGALMVALTVAYAGRAAGRVWVAERGAQIVVPALLIVQPLVVWLVGALVTPILMYRTILPAIPVIAILIALILSWQPKVRRQVSAVMAVIVSLLSALDHGLVQPKAPWDRVARETREAQLALVCPSWQSAALLASGSNRNTLAWFNGKARVVTRDSDPRSLSWERAYFERAHGVKAFAGDPSPPRLSGVRSVAVIMAECSEEERMQIARWLTSASLRPEPAMTLRLSRPAAVEVENGETAIRVERWIRSRPLPAPQP